MDKKIVFGIIAIIQIFAALNTLDIRWDEAAYIMNSKYFSGQDIYLELIRPPILSLLLIPFNWSLIGMRLLYAFIGMLVSYLAYCICVEYKKERAGKTAALLIATNSLFFYWSHWIYSEIPTTMFILASILFFIRYDKKSKDKDLYLAFFMASLSFLTRYTSGIIFPVLILMLIINKKADWKIIPSIIVFLLPILPWLFYNLLQSGDLFYTFIWGVFWPASNTSNFWTYFINLPIIFTSQLVLLPLIFKKGNKKYSNIFLFPLILFVFYQIFSYKESRFFIQIVPFVLILVSFEVKKLEKFLPIIMVSGLLFGQILVSPNIMCGQDAFSKVGELEGRVLSVAWPLNAYYSNVKVKAFPENSEEFETFLDEFNITYIITSDAYGWPEYAKNQDFFSDYELYKQTTDLCKNVWVYSLQKT